MRIRLSSTLAISAVVLLTAIPGALSAPQATALSAPVIHESFTPLGCTGTPAKRTTIQLEGCAEQQILTSDKTIDSLNTSIFGRLPSTSARRDFVGAHKAWLAYRQAYCLSESDVFQGGTEAGVLDADCAVDLNRQHVTNLRTFLKDLGSN